MGYGKRDLIRINLGLCLCCGMEAKRRRCTPCAAKLAAYERKRYRKTARRRVSVITARKRQRRAIAKRRLSYVTVKERS